MGEKIDEKRNNTNDKLNCLTKHFTKQPPQANECQKDLDLKVSKKKRCIRHFVWSAIHNSLPTI